ncbi:ABC transporter permease [Arcticibacterium luteifluviistationis]|uniref:ABC transporter n=1 Tax=Arcticibacterium luteifluviistationis TaxID=1784714 RepID=A0A2Z4G8R9_9BACT|nr:FtsX-like permease family protein [Arcticibacterium luteifluviistationis]AWV97458.1 ABC transporter [Arcticibacterium luteifluviistationis]
MKLKLITEISLALLLARLKQTMVAAFGVTFSIAMFIALLSFMGGLNDLLDSLILNRTPHVRLYNEILPSKIQPIARSSEFPDSYHFVRHIKPKNELLDIRNSDAIIKALKNDENVRGVAPKTTMPVFYNIGEINLTGVINGIDVDEESRLFSFKDYVVEGQTIDLKNTPNSIILGKGAADKMLAQLGDNIQITTSNGTRFTLKVVGFFQSGMDELDKVQSYTTLATTQKMLGKPASYVTDIQVKIKDIAMAPALAKRYHELFDTEAIDIQTANAQFETGSSVRTLISYAVGITLLIVSGFGIFNILNMMIYEKMDSIAILKATGFSGKDVNAIFLTIALTIGLVGGALGLIFGLGFSALIGIIPFNNASMPAVKTYPINYNPMFYVIGAVFSIVTTYLAGYFPSKKASKVDPVDIIRGK